MSAVRKVKVVEVGPRDGLQNEAMTVPAATKVLLCNRLSVAGMGEMEAGSFVSPRWIPQMRDSAEVMARIGRRPGTVYAALVPNMRGFEAALLAKADAVVVFGAASETFSQHNINCSVAESVERFRPVVAAAQTEGLSVRASLSCCFGCPYEGSVSVSAVVDAVSRMADIGCEEIDIADTIGVGTPGEVTRVFEALAKVFPRQHLAGHFHDTYGQALANVYAALQVGISTFHASVAGLGGCPYAKGATGNLATEDLLYMLHGLGIETGIDLDAVVATGKWICSELGRMPDSRACRALWAKRD